MRNFMLGAMILRNSFISFCDCSDGEFFMI